MHRKLAASGLFACLIFCAVAQDSNPASDRRAEEEQFKVLNAKINNIIEAQEMILKRQESFQRNLDSLTKEIDKVRDESARGNINFATREELNTLVKTLQEQREADKKLILQSIKDLAKLPAPASVPAASENSDKEPKSVIKLDHDASEGGSEDAYIYEVKKGDTLQEIVAAYNQEFKSRGEATVTIEQVLKENPQLKPDRIRSGQKIRIPAPAKKK